MAKGRNVFKTYPEMKKVELTADQLQFKLFIGGLDPEVSSDEIGRYFSQFGKIYGVKIVGETNGKPRGFGFVVFSSESSLSGACQKEHFFYGRKIDCKPSLSSSLAEETENLPEDDSNKLFLKQIPLSISKEEISEYFQNFGKVKEVLITIRKKREFAFGFVGFSEFYKKNGIEDLISTKHTIKPGVAIHAEKAIPKTQISKADAQVDSNAESTSIGRKNGSGGYSDKKQKKDERNYDASHFCGIYPKENYPGDNFYNTLVKQRPMNHQLNHYPNIMPALRNNQIQKFTNQNVFSPFVTSPSMGDRMTLNTHLNHHVLGRPLRQQAPNQEQIKSNENFSKNQENPNFQANFENRFTTSYKNCKCPICVRNEANYKNLPFKLGQQHCPPNKNNLKLNQKLQNKSNGKILLPSKFDNLECRRNNYKDCSEAQMIDNSGIEWLRRGYFKNYSLF